MRADLQKRRRVLARMGCSATGPAHYTTRCCLTSSALNSLVFPAPLLFSGSPFPFTSGGKGPE